MKHLVITIFIIFLSLSCSDDNSDLSPSGAEVSSVAEGKSDQNNTSFIEETNMPEVSYSDVESTFGLTFDENSGKTNEYFFDHIGRNRMGKLFYTLRCYSNSPGCFENISGYFVVRLNTYWGSTTRTGRTFQTINTINLADKRTERNAIYLIFDNFSKIDSSLSPSENNKKVLEELARENSKLGFYDFKQVASQWKYKEVYARNAVFPQSIKAIDFSLDYTNVNKILYKFNFDSPGGASTITSDKFNKKLILRNATRGSGKIVLDQNRQSSAYISDVFAGNHLGKKLKVSTDCKVSLGNYNEGLHKVAYLVSDRIKYEKVFYDGELLLSHSFDPTRYPYQGYVFSTEFRYERNYTISLGRGGGASLRYFPMSTDILNRINNPLDLSITPNNGQDSCEINYIFVEKKNSDKMPSSSLNGSGGYFNIHDFNPNLQVKWNNGTTFRGSLYYQNKYNDSNHWIYVNGKLQTGFHITKEFATLAKSNGVFHNSDSVVLDLNVSFENIISDHVPSVDDFSENISVMFNAADINYSAFSRYPKSYKFVYSEFEYETPRNRTTIVEGRASKYFGNGILGIPLGSYRIVNTTPEILNFKNFGGSIANSLSGESRYIFGREADELREDQSLRKFEYFISGIGDGKIELRDDLTNNLLWTIIFKAKKTCVSNIGGLNVNPNPDQNNNCLIAKKISDTYNGRTSTRCDIVCKDKYFHFVEQTASKLDVPLDRDCTALANSLSTTIQQQLNKRAAAVENMISTRLHDITGRTNQNKCVVEADIIDKYYALKNDAGNWYAQKSLSYSRDYLLCNCKVD